MVGVRSTFYALKVLSWCGIVWDLQSPPAAVVRGEQRLGRKVIDKVARQLAGAFPIERIAAQAHETLAHLPTWAELQSRGRLARGHAEAFLAEIHLPHLPSVEEIRGFAEQRLARTVSLDEIAPHAPGPARGDRRPAHRRGRAGARNLIETAPAPEPGRTARTSPAIRSACVAAARLLGITCFRNKRLDRAFVIVFEPAPLRQRRAISRFNFESRCKRQISSPSISLT